MDVKCQRLEGKVAVVTASTQGIGLAIAERLGLEGAAVVISSRKQVQLSRHANLLVSFITLLACCLLLGFSLLLFLIVGFLWIYWTALQKNVDEAVEGLRAKGITVVGTLCHVSDAQQRKNLIETAVKVGIVEEGFSLSALVWLSS